MNKQIRDAATTIHAIGLAGIALPAAPRVVGIASPKASTSWEIEELGERVAIREWLQAPSLADGVVVDTRKPGELAFVHVDVLVRVPYTMHNGRVWVEVDHLVFDGRAMHDPELLFGVADALERMGARLTQHDQPISASVLVPARGSWS